MQALYEEILEDERILKETFTCEVLARQAEASDNQALIEFFRWLGDENRRRAKRAEQVLTQQLPKKCPHKA